MGLIDEARWSRFSEKQEKIETRRADLDKTWIQPGSAVAAALNETLDRPISHEYSLSDLLRRPNITVGGLLPLAGLAWDDPEVNEQLEIDLKYAGYIERQTAEIQRLVHAGDEPIPLDLDFSAIRGLSNEMVQKLGDTQPVTVAQASRIPGVTPAAMSLLLIHLKKRAGRGRRSASTDAA